MNRQDFILMSSVVIAFVIVVGLNTFFYPHSLAEIKGVFYGDVNSVMNINFLNLMKILFIFIGETGVLSSMFYLVSKRFM